MAVAILSWGQQMIPGTLRPSHVEPICRGVEQARRPGTLEPNGLSVADHERRSFLREGQWAATLLNGPHGENLNELDL